MPDMRHNAGKLMLTQQGLVNGIIVMWESSGGQMTRSHFSSTGTVGQELVAHLWGPWQRLTQETSTARISTETRSFRYVFSVEYLHDLRRYYIWTIHPIHLE